MSKTLADIAKELGISRCTVSRAMNNSASVNEETRRRVMETIEQMGYKPNKGARALVRNRKYRVAAVLFSKPRYFWEQVREGLLYAAEELLHLGFVLDIFDSDISHPEEQAALVERIYRDYDGLILAPNDPDLMAAPVRKVIAEKPVVLINTNIPDIHSLCYVGCDYHMCGNLAGEIMRKLACKGGNILMLGTREPVLTVKQRILGFRSAFPPEESRRLILADEFHRDGENFIQILERVLGHTDNVCGIYTAFSALPETAGLLQKMACDKKIFLVGNDMNQETAEYMREGIIDVAITHEPFAQGYFPVKILMRKLSDGLDPIKSIVQTKAEAVFLGNIDCYLSEENRYLMII